MVKNFKCVLDKPHYADHYYKLLQTSIVPEHPLKTKSKPLALCMMVKNAVPLLPRFLYSLINLNYPKHLLHLRWSVQGRKDKTFRFLQKFKKKASKHYGSVEVVRNQTITEPITERGHDKQNRDWMIRADNLTSQCRRLKEISEPFDMVFWDVDVYPPSHALHRMLQCELLGADIAGGLCIVTTNPPFFWSLNAYFGYIKTTVMLAPCSYRRRAPLPKTLLSSRLNMGGVGAGFMYVKREVTDKVPFRRTPETGLDFRFCTDARQKGFLVYADLGCLCKHLGRDIEVWNSKAGWVDLYYRIAPNLEDHYRDYLRREDPERKYLADFTRLNVGCGDKPFLDPEAVNVDVVERDAPNFQLWNGEKLPFKDATFDLVYSQNCVEHCQDPLQAVSELHRVSKDRVEIWLPEYGGASGLSSVVLARFPYGKYVETSWLDPVKKEFPRTFIAWHKKDSL
jgi:hypothetical protein